MLINHLAFVAFLISLKGKRLEGCKAPHMVMEYTDTVYIDISGPCPGQTGHIVYTVRSASGISRGRNAVGYYSAFMHCCHCELDTSDDKSLDGGRAIVAICGMIQSSYNRFKSNNLKNKAILLCKLEWDKHFWNKSATNTQEFRRSCLCMFAK